MDPAIKHIRKLLTVFSELRLFGWSCCKTANQMFQVSNGN
jgi:hypothetical protein